MLRVVLQVLFALALVLVILYLRANLLTNMRRLGVRTDFGYLDRAAGFRIAGSGFRSSQPVLAAIVVGIKNTALVTVAGIALATILGTVVGIARLSTNWLVRRAAGLYVETLRNVPLLLIIIFWSTAVLLRLPPVSAAHEWGGAIVLSNAGLWVPWVKGGDGSGSYVLVLLGGLAVAGALGWWRTRRFDRTGRPHHRTLWGTAILVAAAVAGYLALDGPVALTIPEREGGRVFGGISMMKEYAALLFGLTLYTASHIAEIVRASILAVPRGQAEAATAVGLSPLQRLRFVVLPQALRILVPPLANQYLNLAKNTSLAVAIGYAEIMAISNIIIGNGNPAPQSILIAMTVYLGFSLAISSATNLVNRRLAIPTR